MITNGVARDATKPTYTRVMAKTLGGEAEHEAEKLADADYNVFLISRIWREADRQDLRPAIRTAGSRAGSAITVAGLILALSFAAVALIPTLAFREMAFAMSVGLLLDTLIGRTLLIPSLVSLFGRGGSE